MTITKITTHTNDGIARLISQYKESSKFKALISSLIADCQNIENGMWDIFGTRSIDEAYGQTLDNIGLIVGQSRNGLDDPEYRVMLYVKIGQNTSQGDPEKIISIFKLMTGTDYVHYINLTGAEIQLLSTVDFSDQDEANFVIQNMQAVVADAVRLDYIIIGDPTESFAYDSGINSLAPYLGYDDGTGTVGGKYAKHWSFALPFAYSNGSTGYDINTDGYGVGSPDPLAGGIYS